MTSFGQLNVKSTQPQLFGKLLVATFSYSLFCLQLGCEPGDMWSSTLWPRSKRHEEKCSMPRMAERKSQSFGFLLWLNIVIICVWQELGWEGRSPASHSVQGFLFSWKSVTIERSPEWSLTLKLQLMELFLASLGIYLVRSSQSSWQVGWKVACCKYSRVMAI